MNGSLRWGILGTGNIARQFAAGARAARRGRLVAVASRNSASARTFADEYAIPQALGDYAALMAAPDVDAIYLALPNSMHHAWTIAALRAGKHVLCEKPIAANAAEAQEMFEVARRAGRVLMEAFMYRCHPQTLAVMDALRAGAIGRLKLVRTSFCFLTRRVEGNIRFDRTLAGGALMDVGCYCVNFVRHLAGGADPVSIDVAGTIHPSGVDELATGTLAFPGGLLATFACGMTVQADNTASLCGSDGYIEIPVPWKPPVGRAGFTVGQSTPARMDSPGQQPAATPPPRQWHPVESEGELYAIEADDFAAAVLDGRAPRVSADESIGNMRILDTMRRRLGIL